MKILTYGIIGLFLVTGGLATTYYIKSRAQDAKIEVLQAENAATKKSLQTISNSVAASDLVIRGMTENLSQIDKKGSFVAERMSMLERNNAQIRDLLATALPAGGCLLDDTCDVGAIQPAQRGAAGALRTSAPSEVGVRPGSGGEQQRSGAGVGEMQRAP